MRKGHFHGSESPSGIDYRSRVDAETRLLGRNREVDPLPFDLQSVIAFGLAQQSRGLTGAFQRRSSRPMTVFG